jgi:DHA1 family inner membrane transport protein
VLSLGPVRRALLALAVGGFAIGTGEFVVLGLLPNVASGLDITIPQAGHLVSAYAIGVVVGAPLLTVAFVALPRKGVLVGLMLAFALGNVASAVAPSYDWELAARFASGLPHGAFFGVGAVAAANMVPYGRRTAAMSVMFTGLTVANIVGVPLTTLLGQHTSWRLVFALIALVAAVGATSIAVFVPTEVRVPAPPGEQNLSARQLVRDEFAAFTKPGVWLVLGGVAVGGGGLFATFSYINPMMTHLAGYSASSVTFLLVLFGLGMTVGNLVGARLADRALMPTMYAGLTVQILIVTMFVFTSHSKIGAAITIFLYPAAALAALPAMQSRMITLAGGAPNLAAAAIQGGFNVSNSLGAWLGGLAIAAGLGYDAPNVVAIALTIVGLGFAIASGILDRRGRGMPQIDSAAPAPGNRLVVAGAGADK